MKVSSHEPMGTITMSRKEVPRAGVLQAAVTRQITNAQVAAALHLSQRQVQRLKRRYRSEGAARLRHRARGRPSARRLRRRRASGRRSYCGRRIAISTIAMPRRSSARWKACACGAGSGCPASTGAGPAATAPAGSAARALVQLDASVFDWLEERRPRMTLHGAIDDATGTVLALVFRPTRMRRHVIPVEGRLGLRGGRRTMPDVPIS